MWRPQPADSADLRMLLRLGYEVLRDEVYRGVVYTHLDPYLGYLHSIQFAKPSLVCDIQEIFRGLIDELLKIQKEVKIVMKIVVPKGHLEETTVKLLQDAGIGVIGRDGRQLFARTNDWA